jgi:hypothetical protein
MKIRIGKGTPRNNGRIRSIEQGVIIRGQSTPSKPLVMADTKLSIKPARIVMPAGPFNLTIIDFIFLSNGFAAEPRASARRALAACWVLLFSATTYYDEIVRTIHLVTLISCGYLLLNWISLPLIAFLFLSVILSRNKVSALTDETA